MISEKDKRDFLDCVIMNPFLRNFIKSRQVLQFIACQFALESDFGHSSLALTCHNYVGMKIPYKRVSYRIGVSGDFSAYDGMDSCCLDYLSWLFYNRPYQNVVENLDSFIIFLRNTGYCPEKDYIDQIQFIYKTYFKN